MSLNVKPKCWTSLRVVSWTFASLLDPRVTSSHHLPVQSMVYKLNNLQASAAVVPLQCVCDIEHVPCIFCGAFFCGANLSQKVASWAGILWRQSISEDNPLRTLRFLRMYSIYFLWQFLDKNPVYCILHTVQWGHTYPNTLVKFGLVKGKSVQINVASV